MDSIGRIKQVRSRDVWAHEARDFTTWLAADGIEHLADQLGIELHDVVTEQPEGDLFADIVGTDSEGRRVVIENQLARTDHGHLGQVVTYLAIEGAEAAVWISPEPRAEHIKSVEWLNEQTEFDIWLVRLSVIQIGDSLPAPQFTVVAGPEVSKQIRKVKQAGSGDSARKEAAAFWDAWLPIARETIDGISLPKTGPSSVFIARRIIPGLPVNYHAWSTKTEAYAEVRIQDDSEPANDAIFDAFHTLKEQIEDAYGEALVWDRLDGKHGSKIDTPRIDIGSRADPTETGLRDLAIASDRLIAAIRPFAERAVQEGRERADREADSQP